MIPCGKQFIDKNDITKVIEVLKSDYLTQGPKVKELENALAAYCGAKYAVLCSSGTSALHLAYMSASLNKGDEVITSPNTFAATANMLMAVGAKPVFMDIRLDTYNIDENKIEKLISKRTKAIVPVHFAGQSCEMDKIKRIAKKYKLLIIEDACHALGGKYKQNIIGSCKYSNMSVFSFHPVKSITTGEGGAVLTNNKKYYEKLLSFRSHGIHKNKDGKNVMVELGYNYRITDIQCALGLSQLKKLDGFIKKRQEIIKWYEKELGGIKEIILPQELPGNYSAWYIYTIRTAKKSDRDGLMKYLKYNGIGVNFHYPAVYSHPYYRKNGYGKLKLKNMEEYHNSCITLPCYMKLERKDIKYIREVIREFFNK